jgi:GH24 family phage-related lysozyme (muramidase)
VAVNPRLVGATLVFGSASLLAFLGTWEGSGQNIVYADKLANGLPTVCKGLTHYITDTPIVVGERWSDAKCADEEQRAIIRVQTQLLACFGRIPPQNVFDAATSHAWSFGAPSTCASAAMRAWRVGDWDMGCRRLQMSDDGRPVWSFVTKNGKLVFVQGLENRRGAEHNYCVKR